MNADDMIKEYGIDFAVETIAKEISKKIDKYKETKDKESEKELARLLYDRKKIYENDLETIKKYVKLMEQ